jgi:hypothetical protein
MSNAKEERNTVPCWNAKCSRVMPVEGIQASDDELHRARWICLDGRLYCSDCALQALAEAVTRFLDIWERSS